VLTYEKLACEFLAISFFFNLTINSQSFLSVFVSLLKGDFSLYEMLSEVP